MPRQKPRKNPKPSKLDESKTMDTPPTPTTPPSQKGSGNWEVLEDVQHSGKLDKTMTMTTPLPLRRSEGSGKWTGRGDIVIEQFRSESDSPDSSVQSSPQSENRQGISQFPVDGSEFPNLTGTPGTPKSPKTANNIRVTSKSPKSHQMSTQKKSKSRSSNSQLSDPKECLAGVWEPDPAPTPLRATGRTADWDEFLSQGNKMNFIPSVSWFKYAPLSDRWNDLALSKVGCVVEVPNTFIRTAKPVYWYGTIICFAGYKAYVQYENLGVKTKYGGWMSFCSEIPKPFGYCDKNGIVLYPPPGVKAERPNYLELARKNLRNFETLPKDHHSQIFQIIQQYQKYALNTLLEVMDRDAPHRMRLAEVTGIVGDRIHVTYLMKAPEKQNESDPGYWFNVNSDYVHPIGFSSTVGFQLYNAILHKDFKPLPDDYFPKYPPQIVLKEGQMLEARHPHHPQQICAASISKVYKFGYFLAAFYTKYDAEPNHFGFHVTSPYIFPCGWSEDRHVPLIPPFGELAGSFDWNQYCWDKKVEPAPLHLLPQRNFNKFYPGHKLEACCCIYPTYLGPATVRKTADHLLYISFDGWPRNPLANDKSDLWIDGESYDIYPIGYAELVGHEFQGQVEPPPHVDWSERYKELKEAKTVGKKSSPKTCFAAED